LQGLNRLGPTGKYRGKSGSLSSLQALNQRSQMNILRRALKQCGLQSKAVQHGPAFSLARHFKDQVNVTPLA
jgi:hypothetical protein